MDMNRDQKTLKPLEQISTMQKQSGYVLIVSVILLAAMLIATLGYFEQSTTRLQTSGFNRDSAEALLLAESASNSLYGQFVFNDDIDNDGVADRNELVDEDALDQLPLFYMYFISSDDTINKTEPSILQLIANGEARSSSNRTDITIVNNQIPVDAENIIIDELFTDDAKARPVVYTLDNNRKLSINSTDTWTDVLDRREKVAIAWFELVRDSGSVDEVGVYVQAVAQVGQSKNYIQRFVGIFPNRLGSIGAANESNP